MSTIKYRLAEGSHIVETFVEVEDPDHVDPDTPAPMVKRIEVTGAGHAYIDGVKDSMRSFNVNPRLVTIPTWRALTGIQKENQLKADIVAMIPDVFGPGHVIEEDNS